MTPPFGCHLKKINNRMEVSSSSHIRAIVVLKFFIRVHEIRIRVQEERIRVQEELVQNKKCIQKWGAN